IHHDHGGLQSGQATEAAVSLTNEASVASPAIFPLRECPIGQSAVCIKKNFATHYRLCVSILYLMHTNNTRHQMNPISHSRAAQVAYQDLLRMHLEEAASEVVGSIEERQRNGRTYLYDRFRIGTEMKSRYLGEDSP